MNMLPEPLPSAQADAVRREFLQTDNPARPLALSPTAQAELLTPPPTEAPENVARADTPVDPMLSPQAPSEQNFLAWMMHTADVGKVEVEHHEKALFLKAVLNDEEIMFHITLPLGGDEMTICCRTLTAAEMTMMFEALNRDEKEGKFRDPAQYATAMHAYAIAMQIVSVNGQQCNCFRLGPDHDVDALRSYAATITGRTHHVRWHYLLLALRIFTIKIKLCTDAALNQDFWQTAGTD